MHIISRKKLKDFWNKHRDAEQSLKAWYKEVSREIWKNTMDIKNMYPTADFIENNRVIFNIKGNKYRLIVKVIYKLRKVFIRFVGTHAEYDKINTKEI